MSFARRTARAAVAFSAASAVGLSLAVVAAPGAVAAPPNGLLAEYLFNQASGSTVANTAPGATLGAATVTNLQASDWTGSALTLRGGSKTSTGNWVELPDDLLAGEQSTTISAEVKASATMLNGFHFLWNVGNDSPTTEYLFASLNCGSGRSPLVGIKSGGDERLAQASSCGVTANQWVNVTSVIDGDAETASLYIDGRRVARTAVPYTPADITDQSRSTIARAPWPDPLFQGAVAAFRVYDRALSDAEIAALSDEDAGIHASELQARAQAVLTQLALTDLTTSTHIDLPTAGGQVTWTSSNPDLVAPDGTVNPPLAGQSSQSAVLTAAVTLRGQSATTSITVTVSPSTETPAQRADRLARRLIVPAVVASGTALPAAPEGTTITATSATDARVTLTGGVIATSADAAVATPLTVTVRDDGTNLTITRTFEVTVLPSEASRALLAYDRTPTSVTQANNADVALSLHLALAEGEDWTPLNENYGIFFPKLATPAPASGTQESQLRSLKNPHVFYQQDGSFGIVATRTARNGAADGTQTSRVLLARSDDLLTYEEVGLLDLGVTSGVNDPAVVFDSAADAYVVTWTSDAGAAQYTTFSDLTDPATRTPVQRGEIEVVGHGVSDTGVENLASGNELPITPEVATALEGRFGRVVNTGAEELDGIELQAGEQLDAAALPERLELSYDDGSTGSLALEWDAASLAGVDTDVPGEYTVTGSVKQPVYPTPFADERADPSIYPYVLNGEQKFMMIATEDLNLNPVDPANGPHMPFRIADTIEDLSDEAVDAGRNVEVDLLRAGDTDAVGGVMTGCFWAPELHTVAGVLTVFFMPCYDNAAGNPDMWTGRASIIQLKKDGAGNDLDPTDPASWTKAEKVVRADGSILNPIQNISLDMTYFTDSGTHYYAWQMLGSVFIAEFDPAVPTRLTTTPQRIIVPEYAWDNTIAEGPNVLVRDGVISMIYSGSTVGDSYTTGLVTAPAGVGADLSDISSWTKLNYPIQKSGIFNGEWQLGTGHGMWSADEDGNLLYVFHARTDHNGLSGRDMFVRRVHFAADGMPVLDMETDEEVAPENRDVSVTVTVTPAPITFTDVPPGAQFHAEISWLAAQGISTGWLQPDGTRQFQPVTPVNRDAMAAFLYRAAGSPAFTPPTTSPFTDVPTTNLFYKEIAWLADRGISTGWSNGNGTSSFRPLAPVARDAMAAFLYRSAGSPPTTAPAPTSSPFRDVPANNQFYDEIVWLADSGISTGWPVAGGGADFRPLASVNRDAMAAFLFRLDQLG